MSENAQAPATEAATTEPTTPAATEPAWYLDEKTPGAGERPDWLPSKYKRASDVGRAYSDLEKKLGGFTGAPDVYDISNLELDAEQHIVKQLVEFGKETNMSQEKFNKLLGTLNAATEAENQVNLDEQVRKLGPDGERELTAYKNWTKDYLAPEEVEVVKEWVRTADDLKVFNRMMAKTNRSAVPTTQTMAMANGYETVTDIKNEMVKNIDRYDKDQTYRKDLGMRLNNAYARNPNS